MKILKYYPMPVKEGNYRLALLELDYRELSGLKRVVDGAVESSEDQKIILLNFEEGIIKSNPTITVRII